MYFVIYIYNYDAAQNSEILNFLKISNSISIPIIKDIIVYMITHRYTDLFNLNSTQFM